MGLRMPLDLRGSDCWLRQWTRYIGRRTFASLIASLIVIAAMRNSASGEPQDNSTASRPANKLATVQEMIDAPTDVWGDAAMREPNGASYQFFKDLLPPLRWVNTEFRHYP